MAVRSFWELVTVGAGIQTSLKTIFSAITVGGIDRENPDYRDLLEKKVAVARECRSRFIADFQFNIFEGEYAILYEIISTLQVNTFNEDQLKSIIDNNRD